MQTQLTKASKTIFRHLGTSFRNRALLFDSVIHSN